MAAEGTMRTSSEVVGRGCVLNRPLEVAVTTEAEYAWKTDSLTTLSHSIEISCVADDISELTMIRTRFRISWAEGCWGGI